MAPNDPNLNPNQDAAGAAPEPELESTTDAVESTAAEAVAAEPVLDMDAINEAVAATANEGNNIQNTFDVNDISLDNVPTSDAELQKQMADNPNMSLANGGDATTDASSGPVDFTNTTDPINNAATSDGGAPKSEEAAGFVDGDLTNEAPSAESSEPPAVAANVVTAPGAKKSNKPLFMALGGVGIFAIIIIAIIIIMSL